MDFPSTMGAPRMCYSHGGKRFWMVKPLSLEGHAILLQWLDDVLPGREERKIPPSPATPEALKALDSPTGRALMIWLALRDHGLNEEQAAQISDTLTDVDRYVFVRALQTRRRTALPREAETEAEEGRDISETWCEKGMAELVRAIGLRETMALSLDQYEWLMRYGELEMENPSESPEALAKIQAGMKAKWGEKLAKLQIAPDPRSEPVKAAAMSVAEELESLGLRVKPDEGQA
jgi:hypothetical protein